jgi:RHS repeat-associated protein
MKIPFDQSRVFASLTVAIMLMASSRPLLAQGGPPLNIQPSGAGAVQITWPPGTNFNVLEESLGLDGTNFWEDVPIAPSPLGALYSVRAATTNSATFYRLSQRGTPGITTPPDPVSVASALKPNVYNPLGASTAFLYSGPNPIQIGVVPGTIQAVQAAVLRGRVLGRNNIPIPGVRVALLNHPEFGYTYTRTNGMFDMAVNASQYTVDFETVGYLEAQRQAQLVGQSYHMLPDVVMIPVDSMSTVITLGTNAPLQVAHSTPQTDAAGTRSATLVIPAGTTATMVLPDGSTQAMSTLTVRVTEYTVGSNGLATMPATLPPNSAYTYCAEFGADEEEAAGAKTVIFSQPLPVYVDDFVNTPVGTLVPVGNYDRANGVWIPMSNGIVLQVLGSTNGTALLDLHGTGTPESPSDLAAFGFTTEELQQLANLYPAGKTLWRCLVPHFQSTYDHNHVLNPPNPNLPGGQPQPSPNPNDNTPPNYGTLNFSSQTFSETIPLVGVPFDLNYNSARVPDYRVASEVTVPVGWIEPPLVPECDGPGICVSLPGYLETPPDAIRVDLSVSGEPDVIQILPYTATEATVAWDGKDAYGRSVEGSVEAEVTISYTYTNWQYAGMYVGPGLSNEFPALFGNDLNGITFEGRIGSVLGIGESFQQLMTFPDHRALGFGGWSPTVLHHLDPVAGILYYGDGRVRNVPWAPIQDGFQTQFIGNGPLAIAAAPDGSIYFDTSLSSGNNENYLCRRLPGGGFQILTQEQNAPGAVLPNGPDWSAVDGQPTSKVSLSGVAVQGICVGPDGSVYITDDFTIARLTPDGIWHVLNGLNAIWPPVYQPDGTPAINSYATDGGRVCLAVGPDSCVYFSGEWTTTNGLTNLYPIRKIAPDGKIYTVYGATGILAGDRTANYWYNLYGTSAYAAPGTGSIQAMAVANDGTIYVSPGELFDGGGMFKISPGGVILPFLSDGPVTGVGYGYDPSDTNNLAKIQGDEGKMAMLVTSGAGSSQSLAVGPDGSVYFSPDAIVVWRVDSKGVLGRVAGRYNSTTYIPPNAPSDGADPLNTLVYPVTGLAVTPDNTLILLRTDAPNLPEILYYPQKTALKGVLATPLLTLDYPSEDGSEIYVFATDGRHLSTLDSLTGATKWSFGYDSNNLVVTMTDSVGLTTLIQRDGTGQPTAIVGPYGQTTALGVDANGFLNLVSNPANESTTMSSTSGGLLSSITGPLADTYKVTYNGLGLVTSVSDPLGGGWSDEVTNLSDLGTGYAGVDVEATNSVGDTLFRGLVLLPNGNTTESYYDGSNSLGETILEPSGDEYTYSANGSHAYVGVGSDPRFGQQVQRPANVTVQFTSNLSATASFQQSTALLNNGDPLSLTGLTNVGKLNGNTYTDIYTATNRTITSATPTGRISTIVLDPLGRVSDLAQAGLPAIDLAYDAEGRLVTITNISSIGAATTTIAYDGLGQISAITDPLGGATALGYDAAGRLNKEVLPDGSLATFTHDSEYNLTSVTSPGRPAYTFQYNAVGSLTKYTPPLVGSDESVSFAYDTERNVTQVTYPDGQIAAFQYGLDGRLQQAALGAGPTLTYQYGTNLGPGYLQQVAVTSSTGDAIQYAYTGSILTGATWSGIVTGQVGFQINADLLATSESVDDSTVAYAYDADGLLTQAGNLAITRDPASGFVTGNSLGVVTDQRLYDDAGLLTNYTASTNGTRVWSLAMSYDLSGRLTNRVETIGGKTQTVGYVYDQARRLQQVWLNGAVATTYTYDTNGNRLTRNSETATYDAQDRVLTYAGSSFTWSPNGTLQSRLNGGQTTDYNYDVRGALVSADIVSGQQISYVTDAAGQRIAKQVNGSLQRGWLWNQDRVVAQVDGSSSLTEHFIYGADGLTPSYMIAGTNTYRVISDESGTVRLVVNVADGAIAQQLDYDEFGRVLADSNPGFQPFGFDGGLYDPDTGLVRFGGRDYSSETGQWTARDPILFGGAQYSLYAYVGNDPINFLDPVGTGPNHKPYQYYEDRFSPHQRRLLNEANIKIGRNQKEASTWQQIREHDTERIHQMIDFASSKIAGETSDVIDATDKAARLTGEVINSLTGNALGRAQYEAKNAGDMTGTNSKNGPKFNTFKPSTWGLSR